MSARSQPRRTEHALDTREALVAAARRLFAAHGYDRTGTEQIVAEARVTRGALYHHFRDKADLFRAAMAEAAAAVAMQLTDEQLTAESASPLDDIREGVSAFLDVCVGGDFQRIVLVDGPRVLGADAWEDLVERYGRGLLEEWLDHAVSAGDIAPVPTGPLARLLIAMLTEASLAIGRAADPSRARTELGEVFDRLLTGLRPLSGPRRRLAGAVPHLTRASGPTSSPNTYSGSATYATLWNPTVARHGEGRHRSAGPWSLACGSSQD